MAAHTAGRGASQAQEVARAPRRPDVSARPDRCARICLRIDNDLFIICASLWGAWHQAPLQPINLVPGAPCSCSRFPTTCRLAAMRWCLALATIGNKVRKLQVPRPGRWRDDSLTLRKRQAASLHGPGCTSNPGRFTCPPPEGDSDEADPLEPQAAQPLRRRRPTPCRRQPPSRWRFYATTCRAQLAPRNRTFATQPMNHTGW